MGSSGEAEVVLFRCHIAQPNTRPCMHGVYVLLPVLYHVYCRGAAVMKPARNFEVSGFTPFDGHVHMYDCPPSCILHAFPFNFHCHHTAY